MQMAHLGGGLVHVLGTIGAERSLNRIRLDFAIGRAISSEADVRLCKVSTKPVEGMKRMQTFA